MSEQEWRSGKITAAHLSQFAYIYIRQSTMGQVTKHKESTELQYGLAQRAERLGWPREAVKIIDEDLGQSGRISARDVVFNSSSPKSGSAAWGSSSVMMLRV